MGKSKWTCKGWMKYVLNFDVLCIVFVVVFTYIILKCKGGERRLQQLDGFFSSMPKYRKRRKRKIYKHEERCRNIFERLFKQSFKSVRPDWLKNPTTGRNLELDGYCESIVTPVGKGLAFEYDGVQHMKYNPHFHSSGMDFVQQTKRDGLKDKMCRNAGVLLIRIPHYIAYRDLESYIVEQLRRSNVAVYK